MRKIDRTYPNDETHKEAQKQLTKFGNDAAKQSAEAIFNKEEKPVKNPFPRGPV